MASAAKAIRNAIKARLDADVGVTATVELGRRYEPRAEDLPLIFIRLPEERVEDLYSDNPRRENRVAPVEIVYIDRDTGGGDLEDKLEDGAEAIRLALMADEFLSGTADTTRYSGFKKSQTADGDRPTGSITVQFEVEYVVDSFAGVLIPDDLDKLTGEIDIDKDDVSEADIVANFGG